MTLNSFLLLSHVRSDALSSGMVFSRMVEAGRISFGIEELQEAPHDLGIVRIQLVVNKEVFCADHHAVPDEKYIYRRIPAAFGLVFEKTYYIEVAEFWGNDLL